ncbi:hydrolase [Solibacillus sp. R5-41]|uniref:HAD hydrolase family protein n=1 Tax=Solibacillus sp. R5-41 TaxID=2048654 RepID=UPI000C127759|nr:HAD hydrolase family protein [Solibacillus sp. R5-41]ATP39497.1 hydrolase [Solibacillus sp. R5-41]
MIFVFDLDGTICFQGQPLDEEITDALKFCEELGHEIIFASARPIRDMLPVIPKDFHSCRMIGSNGAFTFVEGKIEVEFLKASIQTQIMELITQHQLAYLADSDWDYAYSGSEDHPMYRGINSEKKAKRLAIEQLNGFSKVLLFDPPSHVKEFIHTLPVTIFEYKEEKIIDICSNHLNKVKGLNRLGIQQYIAFGNDVNDLLMFQQAQHSVCVGMHEVGNYAAERVEQKEVALKIKNLAQHWASNTVFTN